MEDDIALLTEHFGYPPVSLLDDIINSVNLLAERGLTSIESGLSSAPPTSLGFGKPVRPRPPPRSTKKHPAPPQLETDTGPPPTTPEEIAAAARAEIESGTHRLETLLCASIDRNFDLLELYAMRNILCVRPEDRDWIRLGHYEGLVFDDDSQQDTHQDNKPTIESVSSLRRKLQASQRLNVALHAEKARNDVLLTQLRSLVGAAPGGNLAIKAEDAVAVIDDEPSSRPPLAFLRATAPLSAVDARTPITTTAEFSLSQLKSLRTLSATLRSLRPKLAAHKLEDDDEPKDDALSTTLPWRTQRTHYIEAAARRHLETNRGLELGGQGEVRDGEWQGGGRAVGRVEVEALEAVAAMVEGERMDEGE